MKVMENLDKRATIGYCRLRLKDGKSTQEGEECKMYGYAVPNGVISTKTNEIAGHFSS